MEIISWTISGFHRKKGSIITNSSLWIEFGNTPSSKKEKWKVAKLDI